MHIMNQKVTISSLFVLFEQEILQLYHKLKPMYADRSRLEVHLEPIRTSTMEAFCKDCIVDV